MGSTLSLYAGIALPSLRWSWRNLSPWLSKYFYAVFFPYLFFHYFLFTFLVVGALPPLQLPSSVGVGFSYPTGGLIYAPYIDSESPGIWMVVGNYVPTLTPFQAFIGFLVASLLAGNISAAVKLRNNLRKTRLSTVGFLPILSALSATSCCLAIPTVLLISLAASVATVTSTILSVLASPGYFVIVYFGLPVLSTTVLAMSLKQLNSLLRSGQRSIGLRMKRLA